MKKRILSAFMAVLMMFSLVSCLTSCSGEQEFPAVIGDVTINQEPENIVILDKNLTDIISCIRYDIKMVGRGEAVNQEGLEVVPTVGTQTEPNIKKIKKLDADLVISDKTLCEEAKLQLEEMGIQVVQFETAQTKLQLKNLYENIGRALGGNITGVKKAAKAYNDLNKTLENVKSAAQADSVVKTACYLYVDNGVLKTFNGATWIGEMLSSTGAVNVFQNAETDIVDNEQLMLSNPDFIFCNDQSVVDYLNSSAVLYTLDGLEAGTFVVPLENISMQGFSALDTLEFMLRSMYPDYFSYENTETTDENTDIY